MAWPLSDYASLAFKDSFIVIPLCEGGTNLGDSTRFSFSGFSFNPPPPQHRSFWDHSGSP
jgi:hypothetical protein